VSRPTSKPRTAVQQALVELRRQLGITQLQLALELGVTPTTTARWETTHPPRGPALQRIAQFADGRGALVWAEVFRGAMVEQRDDTRYQRGVYPNEDPQLDLADAVRNVSRAVWLFGDEERLMTYWARILDALVPAHRLVIQRAIRHNAGVEDALARGVFSPSEAERIRDSIEGLRDLERRLVNYQKEAAEKLQAIHNKKRKPPK
jgi:transcriptional regulator with XRE-family HTH domain